MITPTGTAKILDLGLALALDEPLPDDPRLIGGKGYILGTMDYIAPEQARNATDVGPQTDLYSLGCALYFAISGTPPFPGGTSKDKIRRQRTLDPAAFRHESDGHNEVRPRRIEADGEDTWRTAGLRDGRELLLPFATPPASTPRLSLRDAVGIVDTPTSTRNFGPTTLTRKGATHEPLSVGRCRCCTFHRIHRNPTAAQP